MKIDVKKLSITLSLTALGIAIGSIVAFLKLPIFLDTIGIMICTLILGWRYGILCSIFTATLAFFLVSPYVPFYFLTMLGLVFVTEWARKLNWYSTLLRSTGAGIIHGVAGTILSAPITYFLFDGFTASGNDLIVAYFVSKGFAVFMSVVISLTIFAIIDRVLTCWFSYSILKMLPRSFMTKHGLRFFKNEQQV